MRKFGLAALLLGTLAACGGGGSSGPAAPPPSPTPPPPTAQFALDSATPADGASGVPRDAAFSATFTAPLAASSVNFLTARIIGPEGNAIPATITVDGSELKLAPEGLPGDTQYTVKLASPISDTAGHTLPAAVTRTFTTAPQAWDAAATLIGTASGSGTALAATDDAGNVTTVWFSSSIAGQDFHAARLDAASGTWTAAPLIYSAPANAVSGAALSAGPGGNLFLTWKEGDGAGARARLARYDAAAAVWRAPEDIPPQAVAGAVQGISLVADGGGNLTALVPVEAADASITLFAVRYDAAAAHWNAPQAVSGAGAIAFAGQAAVDGFGNVTAAWVGHAMNTAGDGLYTARYDAAAGAWNVPEQVEASVVAVDSLSLSADQAGVVTLAWLRDNGPFATPSLHAARFDPLAKSWSAAARIDDGHAANGIGAPRAVTDAAGSAALAWTQDGVVTVSRFAVGAPGWAPPQEMSSAASGVMGAPLLAVDPAGNVMLCWSDGQRTLAARLRATDGRWLPAAEVGAPATATDTLAFASALVVDPAGTISLIRTGHGSLDPVGEFGVTTLRFK